jgi:hypothetical protein
MQRLTWEHALVGAALLAVLASAAGFLGRDLVRKARPHRSMGDGPRRSAGYVRADLDASVPAVRRWLPPNAQARGPGWIYEAFTPPEVTYDPRRQELSAVPACRGLAVEPPDLELVAVKREPFRLQLVGYVGGEGRYRGVFENLGTGEVTLAGAGEAVPELSLAVADFQVVRRHVGRADGVASEQWVANAVVQDQGTGQSTVLVAGERCLVAALSAVVARKEDEDETTFELRQGDEFRHSDLTYRVERVHLDPPAVELTQKAANSAEFTRFTLTAGKMPGAGASAAAN